MPGISKTTSDIDLDELGENFIPRTSYRIGKEYSEYVAAYPKWHGEASSGRFRLAWREMSDSATVRTLHSALLPPGPMSCWCAGFVRG